MARSLVLAYWQTRRVTRSRSLLLVLLIPAACAAIHFVLHGGPQAGALRFFFPHVALLASLALLYARRLIDCESRFAAALDSTPAAGLRVFLAHVLTAIVLSAVQIAIFSGLVRTVG